MKTSFKTLAAFCSLALALNTGCTDGASSDGAASSTPLMNTSAAQNTTSAAMTKAADTPEEVPDAQGSCEIAFSGNSATAANSAVADSGGAVTVSGGTVTINKAGVYRITGSASGVNLVIDADKNSDVYLILAGANLTSAQGSVILCKKAAKLVITLEDGTENSLSDSADYVFEEGEDEPDAAVFSKCTLAINGAGSLAVNGAYSDGIKSKGGFKLCGGSVAVTAVGDGVKGRDYVKLYDGALTVTSGDDGIKTTASDDGDSTVGKITISGGTISVNAGKDGIQAETALYVDGGGISVVSGGGSADAAFRTESFGSPFDRDNTVDEATDSTKGLKAGTSIVISGGTLDIDSLDDAIHSNGTAEISGGTLKLSSGDDGVHAGEALVISGGEIYIGKSYEGLEGKSVEVSGGFIELNAHDDGVNAAGGDNAGFFGFGESSEEYYISISGGSLTINADGDGLDSNGTIAMSGGTVVINGPTSNGNGALDFDDSFAVSGGTLVALGSSGMAQTPTTLSQPCLAINYSVAEGSFIEIRDSADNVVLSVDALKKCESLIFSTEDFKSGEEYALYVDGVSVYTVTATDGVSGNGANGFGGFGGQGGGFGGFGANGANGERPDRPSGARPDSGDIPEGFDPANIPDGFSFDGEQPPQRPQDGQGEQPSQGSQPSQPSQGSQGTDSTSADGSAQAA